MFSNRMDLFSYCFRSESTRLNVDIAKTLTLSFCLSLFSFLFSDFFIFFFKQLLYKCDKSRVLRNFITQFVLLVQSISMTMITFSGVAKIRSYINYLGKCSNVQMAISTCNPVSSPSPNVTPTRE